MQTPAFVQPGPPAPHRTPAVLQAAWQSRPVAERRLIACGAGLAIALLVALAITCQASVHKGERFRAEQRLLVAASTAARAI